MNIILVIIITLILSAFFSGMEIAFISSNRLRLEIDRKQEKIGSRVIGVFLNNPGQFIVTMLIGNNVALVIYGLFTATLLEPVLSGFINSDLAVLLLQTIISTLVILLIAEFLPKALFRMSPNFFLKNLSIPTVFIYGLFYPVSVLVIKLSNGLLRILFGEKGMDKPENTVFSKFDLDNLVSEATDVDAATGLEKHDIKIFQKALDLSNVKLRACMIPRTEITALPVDSSLDDLKQSFIDTGHSNILIYQDSIDNIIGYFRLRDLFSSPENIRSSIRKLPIVPESMTANKLLKIFMDENKKIALVVDEFGGTSGLVTIEDILEEIVGDIEDEHDSSGLMERKIGEGEWLFSGRLEIDYINEVFGLALPEADDYETLAGLVLFHHESIPKINQVFEIGRYIVRILKVSGTRIELINIRERL